MSTTRWNVSTLVNLGGFVLVIATLLVTYGSDRQRLNDVSERLASLETKLTDALLAAAADSGKIESNEDRIKENTSAMRELSRAIFNSRWGGANENAPH